MSGGLPAAGDGGIDYKCCLAIIAGSILREYYGNTANFGAFQKPRPPFDGLRMIPDAPLMVSLSNHHPHPSLPPSRGKGPLVVGAGHALEPSPPSQPSPVEGEGAIGCGGGPCPGTITPIPAFPRRGLTGVGNGRLVEVFTPILTFPHQGGRDFDRNTYPCQPVEGEGAVPQGAVPQGGQGRLVVGAGLVPARAAPSHQWPRQWELTCLVPARAGQACWRWRIFRFR